MGTAFALAFGAAKLGEWRGRGDPWCWWRPIANWGGRGECLGWVQFHFYPSFFPSQLKLEAKAVFR